MIESLTDAHWSLLNVHGAEKLREFVKEGKLPDVPLVNARIAERCLWATPASWQEGNWFFADYINSQYRSGRVYVKRIVLPNEEVRFRVTEPNGRWCDSLTIEEAKKHLKASRDRAGEVITLNEEDAKKARWAYNVALSH